MGKVYALRVLFLRKTLLLCVFALIFTAGTGLSFLLSSHWTAVPVYDDQPIYQGSSERKEIALTCNVFWGEEFLPRMLDILEEKNVKITFFVGGIWAEKFPKLTKQLEEAGHEIGSHGYAHPHPDRLSKGDNLKDILKCEEILKEITGKKPVLYAPPYGERGPAVLQAAEEAGYSTILWSIDTVDWKHPRPEAMVNKVVKNAHNGAIVLMHPTAPTVVALPPMIDALQEQGYTIVTVGELLRNGRQGKSS